MPIPAASWISAPTYSVPCWTVCKSAWRSCLTPHGYVNGKHTIRIVATEVTDLMVARDALRQSQALLRTMSARLLQLQDEERRRMARDLHDVTGQELAVCVI